MTLVPCPSCARHHLVRERACPFCGAAAAPARSVTWVVAAALAAGAIAAAAACKDEPVVVPPYGIPPIDAGDPDAGPSD